LEVAGGLLGESLEVTQAETVDLPVPAYAEIVLEGIIQPDNLVPDGPLAEWEGYYGGQQPNANLIQITCMTMRRDAIYHDLGVACREHNLPTGLGRTSGMAKAVKSISPSVKEVFLPFSGESAMIAYISIAQRIPGEARRVALAAANAAPATRIVVVVDDDVDVFNEEEVWWAVCTRCTPDLDVMTLSRVLGDPLSPVSYDETRTKRGPLNSKLIIDATKPVALPFPPRCKPSKELWDSINLHDYLA
jgi:2,5-furandicarboxylate decarboxylase 1